MQDAVKRISNKTRCNNKNKPRNQCTCSHFWGRLEAVINTEDDIIEKISRRNHYFSLVFQISISDEIITLRDDFPVRFFQTDSIRAFYKKKYISYIFFFSVEHFYI